MSELALERALPASRAREGWIVSPAFDISLLIFASLLTLPILAGYYLGNPLLAIGGSITLAFAHYCSSFVFYFWDENKAYHRQRWLAFFAGPLLLAAIYAALVMTGVPYVIPVVLFFWNTFHIARQNCGLLSIYRHRAGVTDISQKAAANRAILATSLFLCLWNIETHKEVAGMFAFLGAGWANILRWSAGIIALLAIVGLGRALWIRSEHNEALHIPEALFLVTSVGFFFPFLVLPSSEIATLATLLPHYVQYMAIVWLVHRRKFGDGSPGVGAVLQKLSGSLLWLLPALAATGFSFYVVMVLSARAGRQSLVMTLLLLVAFEHFYLDGLIWSFKQPHVRKTIAPALLNRR